MTNLGDIVSLTRVPNSKGKVKDYISKALELVHFRFEKHVKSVAIKPNLCYYWDASTGYTTDPRVVAGIIDLIREKYGTDVNIQVVESDATAMRTKYSFRILGYEKLAQEKDIELFNLSKDFLCEKTVKVNERHITFKVPQSLLKPDLFINVPKLKTMRATHITCALKNVFGCIGSPRKIVYHPYLAEAIVGINKILRPHLTIVDGLVALGRFPVKLGLLMASIDSYSIDWVASQIVGRNPSSVGFLKIAMKDKIWNSEGVEICGEDMERFRKEFPRMRILSSTWWNIQLRLLKLYIKTVKDVAPSAIEEM